MDVSDTSTAGPDVEVRSEERGPHWIAWLTAGTDPKPVKAVIVVGRSKEEAEARARQWARDAAALGYL
jgi:hypothetical protein